ncbi:hypothetical protein [Psychromicrobium xiongbiense]|uniref:hypothetical protein n=1 Tax=Psychromicrobium xiongbiense TaxID=3051184 RepID=UPI0025565B92|nr:hypothetical protein [Psychromicrobium sp. YIM S02556]
MKIARNLLIAFTVIALGLLPLSTPAIAASSAPTPSQHTGSPGAGANTNPLDLKDPHVVAWVAKIRANGGHIVSGHTVPYTAGTHAPGKPPSAGNNALIGTSVQPMLYPSGCSLSVVLYEGGGVMVSSSLTSCLFGFDSGEMDSWMGFWAWLNWHNVVAERNAYSPPAESFDDYYTFNCVNGNTTDFHTETYGSLLVGGTSYNAAAYDEVIGASCGTS